MSRPRTRLWRKLLILPPILLGVLVVNTAIGAKKPPPRNTDGAAPRPVRVITVAPTDFVPRILGYGTVSPGRVWNAVAQVSGQVLEMHPDFKTGVILPEGTEILRIDPTDYEIAIRQAKANTAAAEAALNELRVREENTKRSLETQRRSLNLARRSLERQQDLRERGTVAQAAVDQEERSVLSQSVQVQELENSLRLIPAQISAQEQLIAVYRTQLETAEVNLARTRIRLPFRARINAVNVEATQFVGTGTVLGVADSIDVAEIQAQVAPTRFRALGRALRVDAGDSGLIGFYGPALREFLARWGLHAIVRMGNGEWAAEWRGEVTRVSGTVDSNTQTIGAIVTVDEPYAKVIPGRRPPLTRGLFVEVEFRTKPLPNQILIPRSAVRNGAVLLAGDDDRLERRSVVIGFEQEAIAVVTSGLSAGDRVIVSDVTPPVPGLRLDVSMDAELQARIQQAAIPAAP